MYRKNIKNNHAFTKKKNSFTVRSSGLSTIYIYIYTHTCVCVRFYKFGNQSRFLFLHTIKGQKMSRFEIASPIMCLASQCLG